MKVVCAQATLIILCRSSSSLNRSSSSMSPRMKTNSSKLLAVRLNRLAITMSSAELNLLSTAEDLGRVCYIWWKVPPTPHCGRWGRRLCWWGFCCWPAFSRHTVIGAVQAVDSSCRSTCLLAAGVSSHWHPILRECWTS